jgi:hypothetical protein
MNRETLLLEKKATTERERCGVKIEYFGPYVIVLVKIFEY